MSPHVYNAKDLLLNFYLLHYLLLIIYYIYSNEIGFLIYGGNFAFHGQRYWEKTYIRNAYSKTAMGLRRDQGWRRVVVFKMSEYLCNYGGMQVSRVDAEKNLLPYVEKYNYLVELREETCHEPYSFYINYDPSKEKTHGQLLNHSKQHANAIPWTYAVSFNVLDAVFLAKIKISPGEKITWDYGSNYRGAQWMCGFMFEV